jgi:hypothetical protein
MCLFIFFGSLLMKFFLLLLGQHSKVENERLLHRAVTAEEKVETLEARLALLQDTLQVRDSSTSTELNHASAH